MWHFFLLKGSDYLHTSTSSLKSSKIRRQNYFDHHAGYVCARSPFIPPYCWNLRPYEIFWISSIRDSQMSVTIHICLPNSFNYIVACLRYSFEIQAVLAKQRNANDFNSLFSLFFIRLTTFSTSYFNDVDLFLDSSLGYLFSFRCTVVRSYNGSMETTTFYLSVTGKSFSEALILASVNPQ